MKKNRYIKKQSINTNKKRQKRDLVIIISIITIVALLTFAETRIIQFGTDFPISNTVLMFTLININLLLLVLLIFMVLKNLVKLLYDRKRKVMGYKLRTKLVVSFISLTILPSTILFVFSMYFITSSIKFWFNAPVDQAIENSLNVGQYFYRYIEDNNMFFLERTAYQINIKKKLKNPKELYRYIQIVQREFNHDAVEVYDSKLNRLTLSTMPLLKNIQKLNISLDSIRSDIEAKGIKTFSQQTVQGELIRTLSTIPFGSNIQNTKAFVVISMLFPPELSENMASISRGFEHYQQVKLLKSPIQNTYYISLSIVGLLVVFCAIWLGIHIAKSITIPIMELAEGTRHVAEGDLNYHINFVADEEIGTLVDSFNTMTKDLRTNRKQLELFTHKITGQKDEIEKSKKYMEIVLNNISTGVISLNARGFITTINKSAEKMFNIKVENILKKNYKKLIPVNYLATADKIMEQLKFSKNETIATPLKLTIGGTPKSFLVYLNELTDEADNHVGTVLVFDDLTELEKAQRMAAWREVARRIAHEVKNPLTPISLSAQRLKRKFSKDITDPVFNECTATISDHVEIIRNLVNEFATFARFPRALLKPCDILPIIKETIALYRDDHENINFIINNSESLPTLSLDRQQIKQAMINLIDNSIASIEAEGEISILFFFDPILQKMRIEVADTGKGISDDNKIRLFEPNFSTKKSGMGLGLTIVNTIISDHKGLISVQNNYPKGAKFVIELPVPDKV